MEYIYAYEEDNNKEEKCNRFAESKTFEEQIILVPVIIIKKTTYTQAHKKAQQKYREKNREKYNESQRELYEKRKQDEDWKKNFNERSKKNNKIYREKKKEEKLLDPNYEVKKRGRPRKDINNTS
jgi:hypothetical protein